MKVLQFTIPVAKENSVIVQEEIMPHFYNHLHRHNEAQITWIIKGTGTLVAGNYMQPFSEGEIYVLGANMPHIFKSDPEYFKKNSKKQIHAITIFFDPNGFFQPILNIPENKVIKKFVEHTAYGLQAPLNMLKIISTEILAIKKCKQGFKFGTFINLLQLLAEIRNWKKLTTVTIKNSFSEAEGLRMSDIYEFTMKKYAENISLNQVASVACLTPQAFCRYFKKHTRKTYMLFLNEIRINEACKKLLSGQYDSISSIAFACGFTNAVSFNRVFKKITSKAPLQFQKDYKDKLR